MKTNNKHEEKLNQLLLTIFLNEPEREYRFDSRTKNKEKKTPRKWRFDFAFPKEKIAFEVEGGTWNGGRHVHPIGYASDCEKYNEAAKQGWVVFRLVPSMITSDYLEELLIQ